MVEAFPVVSVWQSSGTELNLVGQIRAYDTLTFEPRFLEAGPWQMVLPYDTAALSILPSRILSVDWRGRTLPLTVETFNPALDPDKQQPVLTVGGSAATSVLGRALAWPSPAQPLTNQPENHLYSGDAESVIRDMIQENYVDRFGGQLTMGTNGHAGTSIKARARFDNLLELVAKKAKRGGVGVEVVMVKSTDVRAKLQLRIWTPEDRTKRVRLMQSAGTLRDWSQESAAPTATHALVGGAGEGTARVFRQVSTTKSTASADGWGGKREMFVDGPDSFDDPELDQAGEEALDDGAETTSLTFTASEAEGLQAFRDYYVGDKATGELVAGGSVEDVITSIAVTCDENGVEVVPGFGDPDRKDPAMSIAQMIKELRRDVRAAQTRR